MTRHRKNVIVFVGLAVTAVGLIAVIALSGGTHSAVETGRGVDLAFARQMVPHHQDAVEMARIAQTKAQHPAIRSLADDIITAQTREITALQSIDRRLASDGTQPAELLDGGEHSKSMGTTMDNIAMSPVDLAALRSADPFDQAFIDAMIPHHQMAILMARQVLSRGADPEVRTVASAVIEAQSREITQMNKWRKAWYGAESPAGAVPA